jgi:hypothetical protein
MRQRSFLNRLAAKFEQYQSIETIDPTPATVAADLARSLQNCMRPLEEAAGGSWPNAKAALQRIGKHRSA